MSISLLGSGEEGKGNLSPRARAFLWHVRGRQRKGHLVSLRGPVGFFVALVLRFNLGGFPIVYIHTSLSFLDIVSFGHI